MTTLAYKTPRLESYKAGADLSSHKNKFVKAGTVQGEVVACGAGEKPLGILHAFGLQEGVQGDHVAIAMPGGGGLLHVAEAVSKGDALMSDANGEGVDVTTGLYVGAVVDAIGSDSAADDLVPVDVIVYQLN